MALQRWKSQALRWQKLTRYYVNKWHYDGSKWAARVWHGTGSSTPNAIASVPFMITRNMRAQLEQRGFPAHEISALLPKVAHALISDQVSYAQFQAQREAYEAAKEDQKKIDVAVDEIKEIVATIEAKERDEAASASSSANQITLVPERAEDAKEQQRL